ncbi:MAG TPA: FIST N-terminal domain-containing protein [Roseiflexaceae bacterium]|nr:FIST N-terminal domain-containing protein [Roseiflexaceae bacterium]
MQIEQCRWMAPSGWEPGQPGRLSESAELVLLFGSTSLLKQPRVFETIRETYPRAHLLGCSTAGEIYGSQVSDDSLVVTAVRFEHTQLKSARINVDEVENSFQAGMRLTQALDQPGLVHVLVLSDGLKVNGSDLVKGLTDRLPRGVTVTGGLSGDGERFQETLVLSDSAPERGTIAALGLYGERLRVGYGSLGGWDSFGPERLITRSKGNVLYELDGRSALDLYKKYLGEHASGLPATGLLFPLSLRTASGETGVVRTILAIDEAEQSVIFAGDLPQGAYARLMKANFDRLIDGAIGAAKTSYAAIGSSTPELALLISCVGRKLLLKQRIEEEVEGVRDIMGDGAVLTGFYSYGEISPFTPGANCELHNQTMTITTLSEREVPADA